MKKRDIKFLIFANLILISVFCFSFVNAGSIGMSPSSFKFLFEPNLHKDVTIRVGSANLNQEIEVYIAGDLTEYVNLSETQFIGAGYVDVKIRLPEKLDSPGNHRILIGAREKKEVTGSGMIGGISAIQVPIDIFVPYPGKYAEAKFTMFNVNEGEDIPYELEILSLGTQGINVTYNIKIFGEESTTNALASLENSTYLKENQKEVIKGTIKNQEFKPGSYIGFADISYGKNLLLNSSFSIGTFDMEVRDYDYEFIQGKINKFSSQVGSLWNSPLENVYLEISVTENGEIRSYFKTPYYEFKPSEERVMEGYIDATNMTVGRYIGSLTLNYGNKTSNKLVAFYVIKPERTKIEKLLYAAVFLIALLLVGIIALAIKVFISRKNGSKKKESKNKKR